MFALFQPCAGHAFTDAAVLHEILFLGLNQFSKQAKGYVNEDNGCICSKMVRAEIPVLAHRITSYAEENLALISSCA